MSAKNITRLVCACVDKALNNTIELFNGNRPDCLNPRIYVIIIISIPEIHALYFQSALHQKGDEQVNQKKTFIIVIVRMAVCKAQKSS